MNNNIAIKVEKISKRYVIGEKSSYLTLRDKLVEWPTRIFKGPTKTKEFWALKDVSFEVKKGEVVGIIGRNGAGKSTLLKILARITEPTMGKVTMYGRVASMLEVGTGFNPELTGRENIYLNGAIIGMKKSEIDQKFDEIVNFAGVEKFLDTPVKHYSSGMYVRLAFAVAAHLDADILLVDEVLAVGDSEFQKKCLGKMNSLANSGKTIIYVSHNLTSIENLCNSCLFLENGHKVQEGTPQEIFSQYVYTHNLKKKINYESQNKVAQIIKSSIDNITGSSVVDINQPILFSLDLEVRSSEYLYLGIEIINQFEQAIIFCRDFELKEDLIERRLVQIYHYRFEIPGKVLAPGKYQIRYTVANYKTFAVIDQPIETLYFEVIDQGSMRKRKLFPWRGITSLQLSMKV